MDGAVRGHLRIITVRSVMRTVQIVGAGPAGSMAALAAIRAGASVRIFEKSAFPRHKVCGEFLSPAIADLFRRTGCELDFLKLGPSVLREMQLHFGARVVRHRLPEPAYGLSRYELDRCLLRCAVGAGAEVIRETYGRAAHDDPRVVAAGRKSIDPSSDRLFGFKAHFSGPINDAVELFFFDRCYVGVSAVENGATNVCGLAPERTLRSCGFHPDDLLTHCSALSDRLRPLTRSMEWLVTGPLVFSQGITASQPIDGVSANACTYRAGDALGFIDPFTGSGILNAMLTGELAGTSAAQGVTVEQYLLQCRRLLRRPFLVSGVMRALLASGHAERLASLVPGRVLFYATRPAA
jgi:flavin-dependent dehydrogenase